ncbi:hypothetical protein [Actinophytocola sp. NPDC049390]|uniref:hypothetical protein n=1 Tax=Actinophytocola sp. NPDC049390 TaxID=3363894 RepID=UPI0037AB5D93
MKRIAIAVGGFVLGYAYAFVSALVASKGGAKDKVTLPHPPGTCASDCPWPDGTHPHQLISLKDAAARFGINLDGSDRHDVLPTDDEIDVPPWVTSLAYRSDADWDRNG